MNGRMQLGDHPQVSAATYSAVSSSARGAGVLASFHGSRVTM